MKHLLRQRTYEYIAGVGDLESVARSALYASSSGVLPPGGSGPNMAGASSADLSGLGGECLNKIQEGRGP